MDTCISLFQKEQEDRAYRNYVTECLRIITENTAKTAVLACKDGAEIKYITVSFDDLIHQKPANEKTAEQIIDDIQSEFYRLGFKKQ